MKAWFILVALAATLLATTNVAAQAPSPGLWLRNTEQSDGAEEGTYNVVLSWQVGVVDAEHPRATSYDIYRSLIGHNREQEDFDLVGTIEVGSGDVNVSFTDEGVLRGGWFYYVKGKANGMVGEASAVEMAFAPSSYCINIHDAVLNFVTAPKTIIEPGVTYEYGSWAQHRSARVQGWVRYQLVEGPEGMSIDEMEGTVTWDVPATFDEPVHVKLRAWSLDDENAEAFQEWGVRPAETFEIVVGSTTSVDEEATIATALSPNPASSSLRVSLASSYLPTEIRIMTLTGAVVRHDIVAAATADLSVDALPTGSYIVVLQQGASIQSLPLQIIR